MSGDLSIGAVSERTGVATSALRYYEEEGLIHATRSPGGQRRYTRDVLRRVSFVRVAQQVGMRLDEIRAALDSLPDDRTPDRRDWAHLAASWRPRIDARIASLERLRDRLDGCIGCGCLSLATCQLVNPGDEVAVRGPGPRYLLDDDEHDTDGVTDGSGGARQQVAATGTTRQPRSASSRVSPSMLTPKATASDGVTAADR